MALKATVCKALVQIADMDRGIYADHAMTLALQPSETDERLLLRLLAFALCVPADDSRGALLPARGIADADEPDLWQHDLDGRIVQWVEVGQPDERRIARACGRATHVTIVAYAAAAPIWWAGVAGKLARFRNLRVLQVPSRQSQALAALAGRSMQLQVTVQDGQVWVGDGASSVEVQPTALRNDTA